MKIFVKKNHILILSLIILFGVIRLCYIFSLRDGHHVDETWSYGFANSYYDPYIYSESRLGDVKDVSTWKNLNIWLPGSLFRDYITVQEDERFTFDSVLYNKEYDLGPALYPLFLHFICSLFPESFSWLYAFSINLICFVGASILIYLISYELSDSTCVGFFSVFFYMLSGCGTSNYLYLRVYALFTFFVLALFYTMVRYIKRKSKPGTYFFLVVLTILGCMTHYYFLVIAFFLTLFSVIDLFTQKRIVDGFKFGFTMLASVVLFFALYHPAWNMLRPYFSRETSVGGTSEYATSYKWNISAANMHFFQGTVGFYVDFCVPLLLAIFGTVCFITITLALIVFLFRNESWFKKFFSNCKNALGCFLNNAVAFLKKLDIAIWIPIVSSIAYFVIIPHSVSLSTMGYIERYLFAAMSLFIVSYFTIIGLAFVSALKSNCKNSLKYSVITVFFIVMFFLSYRSNAFTEDFMFTDSNENELIQLLDGKQCYVMIHAVRDLVWLSPELANTEEAFIDMATFLASEDHEIPQLSEDCLVLLNLTDFLTDEQKEQYEESGDIELVGLNRPSVYMTADDYVEMIEDSTGFSYSSVGEYPTFIGDLRLYKVSESACVD